MSKHDRYVNHSDGQIDTAIVSCDICHHEEEVAGVKYKVNAKKALAKNADWKIKRTVTDEIILLCPTCK